MSLLTVNKGLSTRGVSAKRRRKKSKKLFYAVLCSILLTAAIATSIALFFNVEFINVIGDTKYTRDEIIAASTIKIKDNMFKIDKFKIIDDMKATLPYLENVKINRKLPSTLEIRVESAKEEAFVTTAGGYIIISNSNKVLANTDQLPDKTELLGSGIVANTVGQQAVFASDFVKTMYENLKAELKSIDQNVKITKIDIRKSYNLAFEINSNIYVTLGGSEELKRKMQFVNYVLSKEDTKKGYKIIDVSNTKEIKASVLTLTSEEYLKELALT